MSTDELKVFIREAVEEGIKKAYPKEWLTKEELMEEFNIGETTLWKALNDPYHPLKYSTFGTKKQMFHREKINEYMFSRGRNG